MPKQIKIGFDKVPSPVTKQFPQLVDSQGAKLFDAAGNPLRTEEEGFLQSFNTAEQSLSVHASNKGERQAIPIEEQFSGESEVSTTLLGVPRSEEQLSLFSDVAVYGLDNDNWNYYTFDSGWNYPGDWYYRDNRTYGQHSSPIFVEESKEQALYLKNYPVAYTYPFGPQWNENKEVSTTFLRYMNFVAMGKMLYQIFQGTGDFAKENFIDNTIKIVNNEYEEISIDSGDFVAQGEFSKFSNEGSFYDVQYGDDLPAAMQQIENFTMFFRKIIDNQATFANIGGAVPYEDTQAYRDLRTFAASGNARPGASSTVERFGVLESKRSFRYQPGRVSGFTYGIRMNADPKSLSNFIEWGCSNKTDEYMFQVRGSEFNIVRRSVIPMPNSLLKRMDLDESAQKLVYPIGVDNENELYETVIPRSKFNGDPMNGEGDSGYFLNFKNVTMFKIEFSWYGAVGAKFYAYIPIGNGECRWVLMHTLVIENGLEQPILKNPDFKFKYLLYTTDTANMEEPLYVYKYGSSYYIDGGDEGTVRLSSNSTQSKPFTNENPIMGVLPKNVIINSSGDAIDNNRKTFPSILNVNSTAPARVDIEEIIGSPDGMHYCYAPSLHKGIGDTSETVELQFSGDGGSLNFANTQTEFTTDQIEAKVIADGVYNVFIGADEADATNANVLRRSSGYVLASGEIAEETRKNDGTTFQPHLGETFSARLSKYTVAASEVGINANEFKIHWLNPTASDGRGKAEYFVGVTWDQPALVNVDDGDGGTVEKLLFGTNENEFGDNVAVYAEWTDTGVRLDLNNREDTSIEGGYSTRLQVDFRLPRPTGENSGLISSIHGKVSIQEYNIEPDVVDQGDGTWRITFIGAGPPVTEADVDVAEVGFNRTTALDSSNNPIIFKTQVLLDQNDGKYYALVSGDVTLGGTRTVTAIQSKTLTLTDDWQLKGFTSTGGDRFADKRFTVARALRFNSQPMYPVIGLRDNAKVNNIMIEEITPQSVSSFTPVFITDDSAISTVTVSGESNVLTPAAFNSEDRLSSIRFDNSTLQPLRRPSDKSNIIYSFFVDADKPAKFDLSNIFGDDRKGVTPGLLNNKAIYFTATGLTGGGNIEMTLTVKEQ